MIRTPAGVCCLVVAINGVFPAEEALDHFAFVDPRVAAQHIASAIASRFALVATLQRGDVLDSVGRNDGDEGRGGGGELHDRLEATLLVRWRGQNRSCFC
jgi:hypothetical protein